MSTVNAAIYCRTSVDDRDDPRLSGEVQKKDGLELAATLGLEVKPEHIFLDIGLSGSKPPARWQERRLTKLNHRPELERMMQAIEKGEIQAVIVRKRDRLFRSLEMSLKFFRFMEEHSIQLYATAEKVNLDGSASSRLELTLMMAVAEFQLQTTRENILQVKRQQKAEGMKMCGCDVLGFRDGRRKGTCRIVQGEVPVVKDIFNRYIAGASLSSISSHLNKMGIRDGKKWHVSHISRILDNPSYIGMAENGDGELIPSRAYPAVIDPGTWYKAQKLRRSRRNPLHGRRVKPHLLSGLVRCGYCGATMVHQARYFYTDKTRRNGFAITCTRNHIEGQHPASIREIFWEELISRFYSTPPESSRLHSAAALRLKIRLEKLQTNQSDLDRVFAGAGINYSRYDKLTDMISRNAAKLQAEITKIMVESSVPEGLKCWEDMSFDEQRSVVISLIDTIKVYQNEVVISKDNLITVFPVIRKRNESLSSARSCKALVPADVDNTVFVADTWNGLPCRKLVTQPAKKPGK